MVAAGATFDNVVEMVTYHFTGANVGESSESHQLFTIPHLALFMKVKDCYFTKEFPTWTGVGITSLSTPGLIVEIKDTAVVDD